MTGLNAYPEGESISYVLRDGSGVNIRPVRGDGGDRYGLIATAERDGTIVAHGAYVRSRADRAEMAFAVADGHDELGIATVLLGRLAGRARDHGISVLTAVVPADNRHMLDVYRDSGYPVKLRAAGGETRVELATSLTAVEPWPAGGWVVRLSGHDTPLSQHDTEDEALVKAAAYQRGLERAASGAPHG